MELCTVRKLDSGRTGEGEMISERHVNCVYQFGVKMTEKKGKYGIIFFLIILLTVMPCMPVSATEEEPVATGPDWAMDTDTAPGIVAESAVLMDIDTGVILYEKNIHAKQYPASVTKLLTCLVASENSELTEIVTFSHEAVFGIERGSSHIGIDEGEQLMMKDCYYAAMLDSANEVASGMAEHVGGSVERFAAMMNEKARELGGTDSNFVNANGLHDDNHYTSAYDMALIGQAFARNEMLLEVSGTVYYHIDPTETQPDAIDLRNHHRMLPGCQLSRRRTYEYTIGGKTGYTTVAQATLVTFAEKDGHRLICVVLKDKSPYHYTDTIDLFEYGFACYENPPVKAQIDVKAQELQEEAAWEEAAKAEDEELPTEEQLTPEEADHTENEGEAESETAKDTRKEVSGTFVLTLTVIAVVLTAAAVCGFIIFRNYRREQERKRRRAEIMARHRARREGDN